jgi:thiamine pyrophosphate-dependent acetolactate synthase large subunit-like protein
VHDAAALAAAIRTALDHPGPTVIEAVVSSFEHAPPTAVAPAPPPAPP